MSARAPRRAYWPHIAEVFAWSPDVSREECPLRQPYQLVRNALAACVVADGAERRVEPAAGHAVLVYDARNPEFGSRVDGRGGRRPGKAWSAYREVTASLAANSALLRRCRWQQIVGAMAADGDPALTLLVDALNEKYGLLSQDSPQAVRAPC